MNGEGRVLRVRIVIGRDIIKLIGASDKHLSFHDARSEAATNYFDIIFSNYTSAVNSIG